MKVDQIKQAKSAMVDDINSLIQTLCQDRRWRCIFDLISPNPDAPPVRRLRKALSHAIVKRPDMIPGLETFIQRLEYYEQGLQQRCLPTAKAASVSGEDFV